LFSERLEHDSVTAKVAGALKFPQGLALKLGSRPAEKLHSRQLVLTLVAFGSNLVRQFPMVISLVMTVR